MTWKSRSILPLALLSILSSAPAFADEAAKPQEKPQEKTQDKLQDVLRDKTSRTQHSITLDGQKIAYTATAGTLVLADEEGKPKASFFYIAYIKDGVKDPAERPLTFSYNGGPGSAALWVNIGAFGPKRVELDPPSLTGLDGPPSRYGRR